MAHSRGTCWGNMNTMDDEIRKTKRMESNRESARRSRLRKQQHMEKLRGRLADLITQNKEASTNIRDILQQRSHVEMDNSVLRARKMELSKRLESLNQIILLNITKADQQHVLEINPHQLQGNLVMGNPSWG